MADSDVYRTILPAGTVITASGQTGPIAVASNTDPTTQDLVPVISAVSGTSPSITFTLQWDNDADTHTYPPSTWANSTGSGAKTAAGRSVVNGAKTLSPSTGTSPRHFRVTWTVSGTSPSFTLALYGK